MLEENPKNDHRELMVEGLELVETEAKVRWQKAVAISISVHNGLQL
jgi:hypothetical protein